MKRTPGKRAVLLAAFALIVLAPAGVYVWRTVSSPLVLDAPAPRIGPDIAGPHETVPVSIVEAPVTYDLGTAVDSLEVAIPRTYGDIEERIPAGKSGRVTFAFAVSRSPFRVRVTGQTVTISATVDYEGRVWYRPVIGPELSASCGTGNEPRPRVRVTLLSTGRLTPNWELRTRTRLLRLEPYSDEARDRCRLTILRIDVTDRVVEATRQMIEKNLDEFDRRVAQWPVRARFVGAWRLLQRPIFLTDSVYLAINPSAARLGAIDAVGDTVIAHLRLVASPEVTTGPKPNGSLTLKPIPPLESVRHVGNGAHVVIGATFSYPVATSMLRKALVGRTIEQAGRRMRIRNVELSGVGGGRVALALILTGGVRGRLYFTGTPQVDPIHHQIHVPDLEYDVGTQQALVRGLGWLKGVDIRDFLRERARLPDSAVVGKLAVLAERGINRTLSPGVHLSGRIHHAEGTGAYATTRGIHVRAMADAELKLEIRKAPALPRLPARMRARPEGP